MCICNWYERAKTVTNLFNLWRIFEKIKNEDDQEFVLSLILHTCKHTDDAWAVFKVSAYTQNQKSALMYIVQNTVEIEDVEKVTIYAYELQFKDVVQYAYIRRNDMYHTVLLTKENCWKIFHGTQSTILKKKVLNYVLSNNPTFNDVLQVLLCSRDICRNIHSRAFTTFAKLSENAYSR